MTQAFFTRQLAFALSPMLALHDSWIPHLAEQLGVPIMLWHAPRTQAHVNRQICAQLALVPYLPDFTPIPIRSLLLAPEEATQLVLRLGLLMWWESLENAIDGRARRAIHAQLGAPGVAVMEAVYAQAAPARALVEARAWAGEAVLYQMGYALWLGLLGIAGDTQLTMRLRLRLPRNSTLEQADPLQPDDALMETFEWLLKESFPQCSWLSN